MMKVTSDTMARFAARGRSIALLIPGLLALFVTGLVAKWLEEWLRGSIDIAWIRSAVSYVIIAIVLGMTVANTVRLPAFLMPGIRSYEFFLKLGVIFLGAKFLISDLARLGAVGMAMVVVEILFSIVFVLFITQFFRIPRKMASLISIGVGVCGVSAIIAASPSIEAERQDTSYAIAVILIFGAAAMVVYPIIGRVLGMSDHLFGVWAGLAVDNTAEAVATGAIFSETAARYATFVKMSRNALMAFVILGFSIVYARSGMAHSIEHKGVFLWRKFPKFVLGFVAMSVLFTTLAAVAGSEDEVNQVKAWTGQLKNLYEWAFLLTFSGVGLTTRFKEMTGTGWRPVAVGVLTEAAVAAFTIVMVLVFGQYIPRIG
jgi:uncharacterized integral membrane protein (TIGR00698 family)